MNFKIVFSPYVLDRIQERGISPKLVKEAVERPDKIEKSLVSPLRFLIKKLYFNEKLKRGHLLLIII